MGAVITFLLASLVLISALLAGANFLAYRLFERPRYALMWSVAFALAALQYSLNLASDLLPSDAFYWQSANMVSFALLLFVLWGHRDRLGLPTRRRVLTALFASLALASAAVTFWYPVIALRTAIAPAFAFLTMTHVALILVRKGGNPRLAQLVAAAIHLAFGLTQGLAAAIALNIGPDRDASRDMINLYNMVNFSLMPPLFIAIGISAIFLQATDLSRRLAAMALLDSLTGLDNRRGYLSATERLWARCRRKGGALTLLIIDLDHFKAINDRHGHAFGDRALQHFARILQDSVRAEDALGRIGGEEFAITLTEMNSEEAEAVANRVRAALRERPLVHGRMEVSLRASFGIAQWREGDDIASLMRRADFALYEAKAAGRDAVVIAGGPVLEEVAVAGG